MLKRFDRQGRFREAWQPIRYGVGVYVAVTKDGYIWTALHYPDAKDMPGLPVVIYRKGSKRPIIDWRFKLPKNLEEAIVKVLTSKGFQWKAEDCWYWDSKYSLSGPKQVVLMFHSGAISPQHERTEPTGMGGEQALVVLDRQGNLISYLDWRQTTLEDLPMRWIHPLPDGSGFYRIEYCEREAVVYFHPLPK